MNEQEIDNLRRALVRLRGEIVGAVDGAREVLEGVHPMQRESARNLLGYLALRRRDLRGLQTRLASLGLSSLGRAESHVLSSVNAVLRAVHHLPPAAEVPVIADEPLDLQRGHQLLEAHTEDLLGAATPGRKTRIMVTMPSEAANDYALLHGLLQRGMNCMRINCAHDGPEVWARMIAHLRRAEQALSRSCRVVMDSGGPKLRTGPMRPGPCVVKVRPGRDAEGKVTAPARLWLSSDESPTSAPAPAAASLCAPAPWLAALRSEEVVSLRDARGAKRRLRVLDVTNAGCWLEATQSMYLTPKTVLRRKRGSAPRSAQLSGIAPIESTARVKPGDPLLVTRDQTPGRDSLRDSTGQLLTPAMIGCTLPEVFDDVRVGESIWFDDGKIGGVVEVIEQHQVLVRITRARIGGENLRGDKGINLPESELRLPALTEKDLEDLTFVSKNADVVELSFANSAQDVELLQSHLERLGGKPAIVLKIETRRGFAHLPEMLLTAMRQPRCGVMIARGDLAVESGFERLAEVQEEILWISEAAHVPVIWATQVLETLARDGMPSRAEITDAAMGHRAECVMLNKGPHVLTAVQVLDDILRRMQAHQSKKSAIMKELKLAHNFHPTQPK